MVGYCHCGSRYVGGAAFFVAASDRLSKHLAHPGVAAEAGHRLSYACEQPHDMSVDRQSSFVAFFALSNATSECYRGEI